MTDQHDLATPGAIAAPAPRRPPPERARARTRSKRRLGHRRRHLHIAGCALRCAGGRWLVHLQPPTATRRRGSRAGERFAKNRRLGRPPAHDGRDVVRNGCRNGRQALLLGNRDPQGVGHREQAQQRLDRAEPRQYQNHVQRPERCPSGLDETQGHGGPAGHLGAAPARNPRPRHPPWTCACKACKRPSGSWWTK